MLGALPEPPVHRFFLVWEWTDEYAQTAARLASLVKQAQRLVGPPEPVEGDDVVWRLRQDRPVDRDRLLEVVRRDNAPELIQGLWKVSAVHPDARFPRCRLFLKVPVALAGQFDHRSSLPF